LIILIFVHQDRTKVKHRRRRPSQARATAGRGSTPLQSAATRASGDGCGSAAKAAPALRQGPAGRRAGGAKAFSTPRRVQQHQHVGPRTTGGAPRLTRTVGGGPSEPPSLTTLAAALRRARRLDLPRSTEIRGSIVARRHRARVRTRRKGRRRSHL
jgi:hypothetical protein